MANLEKTVSIIFNGDDRLSAVTKNLARNMDTLESSLDSVTAPLAGLADNVLKAEAALAALAAGGLAYAYVKSMEFETATTNLSKILGEQKDAIGGISAATLEMSNQYGIASTSLVQSATDFKRAGFSVNEVMDLTKNSIDLVIGAAEAEMQQAEATEIIIATLKGFKAPASEAGRLTDVLNKVSNEYATSVTQLGIGMATLSPIAAKMGFSFEETAGILTPVIEIFRSGDEASTALKMGLLKLIDDAAPVRAALESIGVSQTNANGSLRSGRDILYDVAEAFQHVDEDQKLFVTQQLVGIRQAAKMVEVFDGLRYSTEITGVAMAAGGSIAQEVAAKLATSEIAVNRLKVGFENLGIAVGDEFRVSATGAINGVTDIENALQKLVAGGAFDDLIDIVGDMGDEFGALLSGIAEMLPEAIGKVDFSGLAGSIRDLGDELGDAFEALFGDIDLSTPEGLAAAIQKVVDGVEALTRVSSGIVSGLEPFLKKLGEMVEKFISVDGEAQKFAGNVLGVAKGIQASLAVFSGFKDILGGLTTAVQGLVIVNTVKLLPSLKLMFTGMQDATGALISFSVQATALQKVGLVGMSASLGYMVGTLINEYVPGVSTAAEKVAEWTDKIFNWTGTQGQANNDLEEARRMMAEYKQETIETAAALVSMPTEIKTTVTVDATGADAQAVEAMINMQHTADEYGIEQDLWVVADEPKAESEAAKVSKIVEERIPTEKEIEITLQGSIDKDLALIETQAATIQTALEWTAKLDIAEAEANAQIMVSAFESISNTMTSTGDVLSSVFGMLGEDLDMQSTWAIFDQIEKENALRERTLVLQEKLTEAQIAYMNAKTEAINSGEMNITVAGEGLQPHMEAFMWELLSMIQVRANADAAEFLIGVD